LPELPEVETSCRGIEPFCAGVEIAQIVVRQPKLRWPVAPNLPAQLAGQVVQSVGRRGKYLLLQVESGALMIHLGMSGSLRVVDDTVLVGKHDHVDIILRNGKIIRYNDPRRFGSVTFNQQGANHPLLKKLGVEPLEEEFNGDYLINCCRSRKVAIKSLIMNSQLVVGVGNIYAQESLFRSGIHPVRAANKIAKKRIETLVVHIKQVLKEAIKAGGSSLKDFTASDGKPGYFQHTFQVYGRSGEPCILCGKPLKQAQIGQRTTVYCGSCQR